MQAWGIGRSDYYSIAHHKLLLWANSETAAESSPWLLEQTGAEARRRWKQTIQPGAEEMSLFTIITSNADRPATSLPGKGLGKAGPGWLKCLQSLLFWENWLRVMGVTEERERFSGFGKAWKFCRVKLQDEERVVVPTSRLLACTTPCFFYGFFFLGGIFYPQIFKKEKSLRWSGPLYGLYDWKPMEALHGPRSGPI